MSDPISDAKREFKGSVVQTHLDLAGADLRETGGRSILEQAVIKAAQELNAAGDVTVRIDPDPDISVDRYRVTFEVRPGRCGG